MLAQHPRLPLTAVLRAERRAAQLPQVQGASADGGATRSPMPASESRLIGGATLPADAFWPPTGQRCTTRLDSAGSVPSDPPQAFADECAGCHGARGLGRGNYPNLSGARDYASFEAIVRGGRAGARNEMPFFKPSWLNDDDLRRSYAFLTQSPIVETKQCEPLPAPSASEIADASTRGLAAWRTLDGKTDPAGIVSNVACADCHAPDPLDLAYYGFQDGNILRRGTAHLPAAKIADVLDMVHALRAKYAIGRRDPLRARPFQPGGALLPGDSISERDAAFGDELADKKLIIATQVIDSAARADAAYAETWAIDRHALRIPIPFNHYVEDVFHNPDGYTSSCDANLDACDDHGSIADWIPVAPHIPSSRDDYFKRADTYLNQPNDANYADLAYSAGRARCRARTTTARKSRPEEVSVARAGELLHSARADGSARLLRQGRRAFPNKAYIWDVGSSINLFGTGYARYPTCDTTWKGCGADPAKLPEWPQHLLDDITPGATLSSNFSRLRHPWMTLWWTHFDPTLLVTGDPTAQKDEYFTRSLFWSNNNDWIFDATKDRPIRPTYSIFAAYEVLMHNVATLQNPQMASCKLWPATDFACTAVDVRSGYYPDVINFAEQNQPGNAESSNNVHYQTLFQPTEPARRSHYQLLVANLYRLFFWKLIGALEQDNWMCNQDLQKLRVRGPNSSSIKPRRRTTPRPPIDACSTG